MFVFLTFSAYFKSVALLLRSSIVKEWMIHRQVQSNPTFEMLASNQKRDYRSWRWWSKKNPPFLSWQLYIQLSVIRWHFLLKKVDEVNVRASKRSNFRYPSSGSLWIYVGTNGDQSTSICNLEPFVNNVFR